MARQNVTIGTHLPNKRTPGDLNRELRSRFHASSAKARESGQIAGNLALHKLAGQGDFYHLLGGEKIRVQAARVKHSHKDPAALMVPS